MAITVVTLDEQLRAAFMDTAEAMVSDALAQQFINQNIVSSEVTYTLSQRATGIYTYQGGSASYSGDMPAQKPLAFRLSNRTTPFTESGGVSSTVFEVGPSIQITAGTQTGSTITLTGCLVDWNECRAQVAEWLAVHRSLLIAQSIGSSSITPEDVSRSLFYTAQKLRGPYGA